MKRHFYSILLPVLWMTVSIFSWLHPGKDHMVYAYANIVGTWPYFIAQPIEFHHFLFPTIAAGIGGITMTAAGWGLDKLHVNRWVWPAVRVVTTGALLVYALNQYNGLAKPLSADEPVPIYLAGSMNTALYAVIILAVVCRCFLKKINPQKGANA